MVGKEQVMDLNNKTVDLRMDQSSMIVDLKW